MFNGEKKEYIGERRKTTIADIIRFYYCASIKYNLLSQNMLGIFDCTIVSAPIDSDQGSCTRRKGIDDQWPYLLKSILGTILGIR